ncbi:MAG: GNAT family N-acetyltransferase [Candidatus Hadarchaeales archaeon]
MVDPAFANVERRASMFLIRLAPGKYAYLKYHLEGETMHIDATFTPEEHRGRGLAERLTRAAIEYAREGGLKIVPNCSYAKRYFERHPELRGMLASE